MISRLIVLGLFSASAAPVYGGAAVASVSPAANTLSADRFAPVTATFTAPVNPATVTSMSFSVFGLWSGAAAGDITVSVDGLSAVFTPSRPYSAGERVTVSIARSIAGLDGTPLERGYSWHFIVASSPATLSPVETTRISVREKGEGWIQTYGAYAGDFNEDGYTDLAVPNERSNDFRLFLNDGSGFYRRFATFPIPSGSRPSVNEGADFDRDGHMDYVVGNSTGATIGLFMGDGTGSLQAEGAFNVGLGVRGLAVLDLNGDGYPDVATASRQASVVSTVLNDGAGSFLPASTFTTPAEGETAAAAADMNEDGLMDLVVGSYFSSEIVVLLGDGQGGLDFHERFNAGGSVWMVVTGDVDGDGHADVATANGDDGTVSVLTGDGEGGLGRARVYPSDVLTIAIDLGDVDGDGDLDMVSSNFGSSVLGNEAGSWMVFENDGAGGFGRHGIYRASSAGSCVVLHDRNNDGTLDITAIDELQDELVLFTNLPVQTAAEETAPLEASPSLEVYPNPMGGSTRITYSLETPSRMLIELFDITGRRIGTLKDSVEPAGSHSLEVATQALGISAGSYFIVASTDTWRGVVQLRKAL